MKLEPDGDWLQDARRAPSPNFDARPSGCTIDLLVVHGISLPPGQFGHAYIEEFFCNRLDCAVHPYFQTIAALRVSAHALIRRNGEVVQFVPFSARAWHAGNSNYLGRAACNDFSIGIELEGADDVPYEEIQYHRLAALARALMPVWPGITPERIVGHSDIAPRRKTDPGPAFDWAYLRRGVSMP